MKLSLTKIAPLSLALFVLLSYQFIGAQWTAAPSSPPAGNVPAPINVGVSSSSAQTGVGGLAFDNMAAGNISYAGTEMRSPRYCNADGAVCIDPVVVGSGAGSVSHRPFYFGDASSVDTFDTAADYPAFNDVYQTFSYPTMIPTDASEIILRVALFREKSDRGIFKVKADNLPEITVADIYMSSNENGAGTLTDTYVRLPYSSSRELDVKFWKSDGELEKNEFVKFAGYVGAEPLVMCQVQLDTEITNQAGGAVLASDTATVSFPADSTPRIGVVTSSNSCNTLAESRFSTELLRHTPPSPNNQPSAAGFWTEDTFLANQSFINAIPYKVISPLNLTPGTVINTVADNNCGIAQRERVTVTSTVLSCS